MAVATDPVTNPAHYNRTEITWLDVADDWGLPVRVANALKYVERYRYKGKPSQDLRKGAQYLLMEAERLGRSAESDVVAEVRLEGVLPKA